MREIHVKAILSGFFAIGVSSAIYLPIGETLGQSPIKSLPDFLFINAFSMLILFVLVSLMRTKKGGVGIASMLSFVLSISFAFAFTALKITENYADQGYTTDASVFNPLVSSAIAMVGIGTASYIYSKKINSKKVPVVNQVIKITNDNK